MLNRCDHACPLLKLCNASITYRVILLSMTYKALHDVADNSSLVSHQPLALTCALAELL